MAAGVPGSTMWARAAPRARDLPVCFRQRRRRRRAPDRGWWRRQRAPELFSLQVSCLAAYPVSACAIITSNWRRLCSRYRGRGPDCSAEVRAVAGRGWTSWVRSAPLVHRLRASARRSRTGSSARRHRPMLQLLFSLAFSSSSFLFVVAGAWLSRHRRRPHHPRRKVRCRGSSSRRRIVGAGEPPTVVVAPAWMKSAAPGPGAHRLPKRLCPWCSRFPDPGRRRRRAPRRPCLHEMS